jgi:hypothetical protein
MTRPSIRAAGNPSEDSMMKLVSAAAAVGALIALSSGAQALPAAPVSTDSQIIQVAQGCGPGWARDIYGRCRPMMRAPIVRPRCWWVQTVYGPRRVCR